MFMGWTYCFLVKLNLNIYIININDLTDNEKYIFTQGYEQGQKESLENYDNMINHIEDLHIFRNNFMVKEDTNVYAQIPF